MRILVLCDTTVAGPSVARCLQAEGLTILTAGPTYLAAECEASQLSFAYEDIDELVVLCKAIGVDIIVPISMAQMSDLMDAVEDLPMILTGIYNRDMFVRASLWEAVKEAGLTPIGVATEAPAMYLNHPTQGDLRLSAISDVGYKALSALPGDMVDTCTGMMESSIDFLADKGVVVAAAQRDALVAKNASIRVAQVHEVSKQLLNELMAIVGKLEYTGPGTLSCFMANGVAYWVDLNICLNADMELSAVAGLSIPLLTLANFGLISYTPEGLTRTLISRELAAIYSQEEDEDSTVPEEEEEEE